MSSMSKLFKRIGDKSFYVLQNVSCKYETTELLIHLLHVIFLRFREKLGQIIDSAQNNSEKITE